MFCCIYCMDNSCCLWAEWFCVMCGCHGGFITEFVVAMMAAQLAVYVVWLSSWQHNFKLLLVLCCCHEDITIDCLQLCCEAIVRASQLPVCAVSLHDVLPCSMPPGPQ